MPNYNRVILAGNLTRDIETRHTQGGTAVGKFGLAINRKFKDEETTCFVDCTAFGKTAEILAQYVRKGSPLFVEGRLEYSSWESNDGGKRSKLEVVVESFQFLGGGEKGETQGRRSGGGRTQKSSNAQVADYGDIPF